MIPERPSVLLTAWLGFALAGLFFYPLAAVIEAEPYYLHWRLSHVWETGVALLLLSAAFGGLVFVTWTRKGRGATVALALGALIPLLSAGAGVARQLTFEDALWKVWDRSLVPYVVAAVAIAAMRAWPLIVGRVVRGTLVALSPIALVVASTLVSSVQAVQVIATDREPPPATVQCPSVLALLFDELSFSYLYDGDEIRPDFPQLRAFASAATNHLRARSPGSKTLVSVPGYLAARTFDDVHILDDHLDYEVDSRRARFTAVAPDGVFATARSAGFSPEAAGFYFPYCEMLAPVVDACRSFSFYNVASASREFSPLHPMITTTILWPTQFPHSVLKGPAHARLQRLRVQETLAFAVRPLNPARPTFRYVHFSIPHLPFAFDGDGYNPPANPMQSTPDAAYVAQLHYTDRLFGVILAEMRRSAALDRTTIAVFADHGFTSGGREKDERHVPFIVKNAGQTTRVDVTGEERAELLLRSLVQRCE